MKDEIEPQVEACVAQSLAHANAEFKTLAADISEGFLAQFTEKIQSALPAADPFPQAPVPAVNEERLKYVMDSSRQDMLDHTEEVLADLRCQLRQQQDLVAQRSDEFAQQLKQLTSTLYQAQMQQDQSIAEFRALLITHSPTASAERVEAWLNSTRKEMVEYLESRLVEVSARADREKEFLRQGAEELERRIDHLVAQTQGAWSRQDQKIAELGLLVTSANHGLGEQQLERAVASISEQLSRRVDDRFSEISAHVDQQGHAGRQSHDEASRRVEQLAASTRSELHEIRAIVQRSNRERAPQNLAVIEQAAERASKAVENLAVRVADRELIRMTEKKQAVAQELSLELEVRANEARVQLDKSAQTILNEFGRRFEQQVELTIAEAQERVTSALASQEAEHQAILEAQRRALAGQVLRVGEQSMAEFRSGMKAFLYSCLVAAVGAVDQHAQSTLAGLSRPSGSTVIGLNIADPFPTKEEGSPAPTNGSSASTDSGAP
jgi:hypothetical protein